MAEKAMEAPRRHRAAPAGALIVPSALALLALVLLAGPALLETAQQAAAQLALPGWSRWRTDRQHPLRGPHTSAARAAGILLADEAEDPAATQLAEAEQQQQQEQQQEQLHDRQQQQRQQQQRQQQQRPPGATSSPADWERVPDSAFLAPASGCLISPDGSVTQGPPPSPGQLPFLFNVTPEAVPSKREACSHCPSDEHKCDGPRLPHSCCGVCQFDGRLCGKLYPGEGRSEALIEMLRPLGLHFEDFSPCELFQRIRGRTLWLMGDSQTWQAYYTLECFLREFALSLKRSDPVPPDHMGRLSSARQGYCKRWWPVPPECLALAHGTRVCIVRVDMAGEMAEVALPTLMEHVPSFASDLLVYNSGLHYFEFDGPAVCTNATCDAPGPGSRYLRELEQLAAFREAHSGRLPASVWMDTSPQHFPETGYYVGEFHAQQCVPWRAWEEGEALARRGGMWNAAAAPLVRRLADAHLRTWEPSVRFWATHMPAECTHWCHPSAYHVWLAMLNRLLAETPGLAADVTVRQAAAAGGAAAAAARSSRRAARRAQR